MRRRGRGGGGVRGEGGGVLRGEGGGGSIWNGWYDCVGVYGMEGGMKGVEGL